MLQGWFQRAAKRVHAPGGIGYHDTAAHWHALLTHGWNMWLSQVEILSGAGLEISELAPWLDAPFQCATFEL